MITVISRRVGVHMVMLDRLSRVMFGGLVAVAVAVALVGSVARADEPAPPTGSVAAAAPAPPDPEVATAPIIPSLPPLSMGRIVGELALGGVGLIASGAIIVAATFSSHYTSAAMNIAISVGAVGLVSLAVTAGVAVVGNAGDETGSFGRTFLWTLGDVAVVGASFVLAARARHDDGSPGSASNSLVGIGVLALLATPVVATIAFNRSRRYDAGSVQVGSLVNVDGGHASIGLPIMIHIDNTTGFSLASGSF